MRYTSHTHIKVWFTKILKNNTFLWLIHMSLPKARYGSWCISYSITTIHWQSVCKHPKQRKIQHYFGWCHDLLQTRNDFEDLPILFKALPKFGLKISCHRWQDKKFSRYILRTPSEYYLQSELLGQRNTSFTILHRHIPHQHKIDKLLNYSAQNFAHIQNTNTCNRLNKKYKCSPRFKDIYLYITWNQLSRHSHFKEE